MSNITELVIDRSKWGYGALLVTGTDGDDNVGKMCCLGFLSKACGYSDQDLMGKGYPDCSWDMPHGFILENRVVRAGRGPMYDAAKINDDSGLTREEKEKQLTVLFAENGIVLTFVDGEVGSAGTP